jgi:hypothetical protein
MRFLGLARSFAPVTHSTTFASGVPAPAAKRGKKRGDDAQFQMHLQEIEAQERERKKDEQPKPKA